MSSVQSLTLPPDSLLQSYRNSGAYTDCFALDVDHVLSQSEYVFVFYTSWLFKIERFVLKWAVNKPSNDMEAAVLTDERMENFAAWTVEGRTANQLLMCDYQGRTRSWLMTVPLDGGKATRLYFGSAVAPLQPNGRKDRAFGMAFHLLVGFHKIYARALLRAAFANYKAQIALNPSA